MDQGKEQKEQGNLRKFQTSKYLAAFALTALIFVIGIWVGSAVSDDKLSQISLLQNEIQIETAGTELQYLLLTEHPCESINASSLTQQLFEIGSKLDYMESKLGKKDEDVLSLKEYYSLLEIKHWLLTRKANQQCKRNNDWILYFYSNLDDCTDCEQQGYVLSTLHKKFEDLNIYSFDFNMDNPAVKTVKEIFGIQTAPALIINGRVSGGLKDKETIEKELFGT